MKLETACLHAGYHPKNGEPRVQPIVQSSTFTYFAVAEYLERHPAVKSVKYPALSSSPDYALQQKYLPKGLCGVLSFELKGDKQAAIKWLDALKLISREVHVADIRTCALHPATSTHRQLSVEELETAGISEEFIRLSVGIENIEDILADLERAFRAI